MDTIREINDLRTIVPKWMLPEDQAKLATFDFEKMILTTTKMVRLTAELNFFLIFKWLCTSPLIWERNGDLSQDSRRDDYITAVVLAKNLNFLKYLFNELGWRRPKDTSHLPDGEMKDFINQFPLAE